MRIIFSFFLLLVLSSCGPQLSPFTKSLYRENNWTQEELKRIQFYVSEDIVLRRTLSGSQSSIQGGEIKIIDGSRVEEVIIRSGTPGVYLGPAQEDRFAISFEEGGNDRYLIFGPNPRSGDQYVLLAKDWSRSTGGILSYGGTQFRVASSSAFAKLLVDLKKIKQVEVNSRTAGGRKVDG